MEESPSREGKTPEGKTRVQVFHPESEFSHRILIAGCDPGISVLARHLEAAGIELVLAHRNSSQALSLLKGRPACTWPETHLRDDSSGESNIPEISKLFGKKAVAVITFAVWEEGIVTARNNPKNIRGIEDLARPDIEIVNREKGRGHQKSARRAPAAPEHQAHARARLPTDRARPSCGRLARALGRGRLLYRNARRCPHFGARIHSAGERTIRSGDPPPASRFNPRCRLCSTR